MRRHMLKSKLHRATVTESDLNYVGSISIDPELMRIADIVDGERVTVLNINNGARFDTYAIRGTAGQICLNGAAARLVQPRDRIIVLTFVELEEHEIATHRPRIVLLEDDNQLARNLQSLPDRSKQLASQL